jgi:putative tricarboxylic transport membrane protein
VRQAEQAFTWAILAFSGGYALDATTIDVRLGQEVSAAAFPLAAAIFTAVSSGIVLVSSRRSRDHDRPADVGRTELLFMAMAFLYWLSLPWVGYVVATSVFMLVGSLALGDRLSFRPLAVSVGAAVAFWVVFGTLLGVPLPGARLGFH